MHNDENIFVNEICFKMANFPFLFTTMIVCSFAFVSAEYFKVVGESCARLQNATALFDYLLPCGIYRFASVLLLFTGFLFSSIHTYWYSFSRSDTTDLTCLTSSEIDALLPTIPEWTYAGNAVKRSFVFSDFQNAFLFMSGGAQLAEKNQHHPDWRNLYNTVDVTLTTDDKGCLSTFDIELAQGMNILFKGFSSV
jgi:4a-hydroxytetrahydrobiopterin dehydratase